MPRFVTDKKYTQRIFIATRRSKEIDNIDIFFANVQCFSCFGNIKVPLDVNHFQLFTL